ncbi:porin [Mesorhizobium sp. ESP6-5]|uniref:porin n=1 Tax=unclassified Mesorhizobium TaxID=325217 RepID=UPI0015E36D8A|nr:MULTISPECIES: porin [unclassified Mesorhizobium]MBZ9756965.1 porin [Mesorhizobium sp. ESP6-5]
MRQGQILEGQILGWMSALLFEVPLVHATDAVSLRDYDPSQNVSICATMGEGFVQLPQSPTCVRISGSVEYEITAGADPSSGERRKTWGQSTSATLYGDVRTQTEQGMLRAHFELESNIVDGVNEGVTFSEGVIGLGGIQVGASSSQFDSWLDSAGNVLNDDVIPYAGGKTNQLNYTASLGSGISAMLGAEQGDEGDDEKGDQGHAIDSYMPHLVGGLKLERNWGAIGTVIGYDSVVEEVAAKARLDLKLGDTFSVFAMGGYQSNPGAPNYFGAWNGTYAAWGGLSVFLLPKLTLNGQAGYEDAGTYALAFNFDYEIAPGFTVTPELDYTVFGSDPSKPSDALGGMISIQRDF